MAPGSVWFDLADGTTVIVEGSDLRRVYEELWTLADRPGAISTAAMLLDEGGKHRHYAEAVGLNQPQSDALRRALDQLAD